MNRAVCKSVNPVPLHIHECGFHVSKNEVRASLFRNSLHKSKIKGVIAGWRSHHSDHGSFAIAGWAIERVAAPKRQAVFSKPFTGADSIQTEWRREREPNP
jgi:hypothetical protein